MANLKLAFRVVFCFDSTHVTIHQDTFNSAFGITALAEGRWSTHCGGALVGCQEAVWLRNTSLVSLSCMASRRKKLFRPWQKRWLGPGNVLKMLYRNGYFSGVRGWLLVFFVFIQWFDWLTGVSLEPHVASVETMWLAQPPNERVLATRRARTLKTWHRKDVNQLRSFAMSVHASFGKVCIQPMIHSPAGST